MQAQIVARVAELLRDPEARKSIKRAKETGSPEDMVQISTAGKQKYQEMAKTDSEWERSRIYHVDKVSKQVELKSYSLPDSVVDEIARRMVALM